MAADDLRAGLEALADECDRRLDRSPDRVLAFWNRRLRALLDAHPTPSEPEATVVEEWGVRWRGGEIVSCGWMPPVSEHHARRALLPRPGMVDHLVAEAVVRRTRTTFADQVTEWTEADR